MNRRDRELLSELEEWDRNMYRVNRHDYPNRWPTRIKFPVLTVRTQAVTMKSWPIIAHVPISQLHAFKRADEAEYHRKQTQLAELRRPWWKKLLGVH